jgi:hypothetical protein
VLGEVARQRLLHPVRHPQQRQFPQRPEVAGPEPVGQGGVDPFRRVHVAVGEASAQRLGGHVDQLDLVGPADLGVGDRLLRGQAGDAGDHVGEGLQVLDVEGGDDVDAGSQQLLDVLPALLVAGAGGVGVGQLVDQAHLGPAPEDGVDVHLGQVRAPVVDPSAGHHLEVTQLGLGAGPVMGLDQADHHVGAPLTPPPALVEHGEGLAHPGGGTEQDAQRPPGVGFAAHGSLTSRRRTSLTPSSLLPPRGARPAPTVAAVPRPRRAAS